MLHSKTVRQLTLMFVVGADGFNMTPCLIRGPEPEDTRSIGQASAAGVLHNRRLTACEITHSSVTHPPCPKFCIRGFATTKLSLRLLDVRLVVGCGTRDFVRLTHAPALFLEAGLLKGIFVQSKSKLETGGGKLRKIEERFKPSALVIPVARPVAGTVFFHNPIVHPPVRNCRKW